MMSIMDKIVIDDFSQFRAGKFGALRPHIDAGLISEENVAGMLVRQNIPHCLWVVGQSEFFELSIAALVANMASVRA